MKQYISVDGLRQLWDKVEEKFEDVGDYENLENKPSIEGIVLLDNKTFEELGLTPLSNEELEELLR